MWSNLNFYDWFASLLSWQPGGNGGKSGFLLSMAFSLHYCGAVGTCRYIRSCPVFLPVASPVLDPAVVSFRFSFKRSQQADEKKAVVVCLPLSNVEDIAIPTCPKFSLLQSSRFEL